MKQPKILIVDDNKITLKLLRKYLEANKYQVIEAMDGEECIDKVHSENPDAVLLDVMMPKLDGYETIKRLKKNPKTNKVPVIIVTALNDVTNQLKSIESGADDFLSKPIEEKLLVSKVNLFTELACEKNRNKALLSMLDEAVKQGFKIDEEEFNKIKECENSTLIN